MATIKLGNVWPVRGEQGVYHSLTAAGSTEHHHSYGDEQGSGRRMANASDITIAHELNPLLSNTTTLDVPDDLSGDDLLTALEHLWPHHSAEAPGFVLADDAEVKRAVEKHFGIKPIKGPTALYTNAGRDWVSQQVIGSAVAAATNQMKYIALTANATSPAASDTTLTGEITTASGGLIRTAGVVAHTAGASSTTVTVTHTANGNDSLPVTIAKEGLFNAASSGAMGFETLLATTATLSAVGDALTSTWTINH